MFGHLKRFKRIIVTGPYCSGTRLCALIAAHDTGFEFIDETAFDAGNGGKFLTVLEQEQIIVRAPGMCHLIHCVPHQQESVVIFMRRSLKDILRAQRLIAGVSAREEKEREKYPRFQGKTQMSMAEIKYEHWLFASGMIINHFDKFYTDLLDHPMGVLMFTNITQKV